MPITTWNYSTALELYNLPFMILLDKARKIHCENFDPNEVEICTLLNIKDGACPEDCAYCPQSGHYNTGVQKRRLLPIEDVLEKAKQAKANGATRFCMGAAWRGPPEKELPAVMEMISEIKKLGLETCATLGLLNEEQAHALKDAGLDYYNHNLDTSPEYYNKIITTRTYQDRLTTLQHVSNAGINTCCGGIIGMGETREDRINLLLQLANLNPQPKSVPINKLIPIPGTPLANHAPLDNFEFIRTIAVTRIMLPQTKVRLSAGRTEMSEEVQALCFFAGANSIHFGEKLLITQNPEPDADAMLFKKLGINTTIPESTTSSC